MNLTVSQGLLAQKAQEISRALSTRTTVPILTGIYLQASDNKMILRSNDLEIAMETSLPCSVSKEGAIVLPGKIFAEIVKRLPVSDINIVTDSTNLTATIRTNFSEYNINGLNPSEFPTFPETKPQFAVKIPVPFLKSAIKQTIFVTATAGQPILSGILLHVQDSRLSMVAIDGVRMAIKNITLTESPLVDNFRVVIPSRALNELSRLLDEDSEESVLLESSLSYCSFTFKEYNLITRLLEGEFPPYQKVVPSKFSPSCKVNANDLYNALDRASLLSTDKDLAVKMSLQEDSILIESHSQEIGRVHEQTPAQLEGDSLQISYNSRYIMEGLRACQSEEVYLNFSGTSSPTMTKPVDGDDFLYVTMPLRSI